ncbi:hypothetical protein JVT61DRAFT_14068 [Boletus reticuloceps]|uniref:Rho GTPase-activating protein 39 n=1 Tax=Boletus reticuloceps TaxID=495285 RepID=A0A8I2YWU9_9AGAM|nr:hypothetical protein JVT61DRAFT_14068 [Boletus reticuloceps]
MTTPEPDKTLDVPSPNSTVAPVAPPELSLPKPIDATPGAASTQPAVVVPQVNVNGEPLRSPRPSGTFASFDPESSTWGANFWVTLVDPQTNTTFFACPATGQVSWDPPVGTFVLPPNETGEWWELSDESRGGIPYYYQTKTGETVWERPNGFVIPLTVIQQTALGRRLSQTGMRRKASISNQVAPPDRQANRRARAQTGGVDKDTRHVSPRSGEVDLQPRPSYSSARSSPGRITLSTSASPSPKRQHQQSPPVRRSLSNDQHGQPNGTTTRGWSNGLHTNLPPIPASPYASEPSTPAASRKSMSLSSANGKSSPKEEKQRQNSGNNGAVTDTEDGLLSRSRSKSSSYVPYRSPVPQSLNAAVEMLSLSERKSTSDHGHPMALRPGAAENKPRPSTSSSSSRSKEKEKRDVTQSPTKSLYSSHGTFWITRSPSTPPTVNGKTISSPIPNEEASLEMSPLKNRSTGKPIPVSTSGSSNLNPTTTLASGTHPVLPHDLASDIQQFSESDYARQYFSTHRRGFLFRRRVPVVQMMTWQKAPLTSPLLTLNRPLKTDAVKIFKVIQHIMGDRERERPVGIPVHNGSTSSLPMNSMGLLEEERWLLGEGLTHGELRDEIYCQLMKQLSGNPNPESVFKGWQMLCVLLIAFPPSKNFETYLRSFILQRISQSEGRVDVMAKHCLRRLSAISKKGPRGKPPSVAEIETASDAAFNPSTFGESLDAVTRLQQRNYPNEKIPIILPFLADGILALGGTKCEGIFRVPGDGDLVSELKIRIDRGYYTLENVDDPHVLASLLKLWLRELLDPLVPEELYNDCITAAADPTSCIAIIRRLPTINRRIVVFIISFLQLFLEEKVLDNTKMTAANMALVMAPNLLRCNSDSMKIVFTNAQ